VDVVIFGEQAEVAEGTESLEVAMRWYRDEVYPRLECPQDSFRAFEQFKEVFAALARTDRPYLAPHQFCNLLEDLGFEDLTPETQWEEILVTLG
jgi:hypothetical protein